MARTAGRARGLNVESNTFVIFLFGQLYLWILTRWPKKMPFVLCRQMNYKVLQVPSVQLWLDFAYRAQRRVKWFPTASLVHFCWNGAIPIGRLLSAAGRRSLFWLSRRFCHHFTERDRGLWLSCSVSSNDPCGRQKPMWAGTTVRSWGSFTPKEAGSCNDF